MSKVDNYAVSQCIDLTNAMCVETRLSLGDLSVITLAEMLDDRHPEYGRWHSASKRLTGRRNIWEMSALIRQSKLEHASGRVAFHNKSLTHLHQTVFREIHSRTNWHKRLSSGIVQLREDVIQELLNSNDPQEVLRGHICSMNAVSRFDLMRHWIQAAAQLTSSSNDPVRHNAYTRSV